MTDRLAIERELASAAQWASVRKLDPDLRPLLGRAENTIRDLREQVEHLSQYARCSRDRGDGIAHGGASVCQSCANQIEQRADAAEADAARWEEAAVVAEKNARELEREKASAIDAWRKSYNDAQESYEREAQRADVAEARAAELDRQLAALAADCGESCASEIMRANARIAALAAALDKVRVCKQLRECEMCRDTIDAALAGSGVRVVASKEQER